MERLIKNNKGQVQALNGVFAGFVFVAVAIVLLVLIIYVFGTVHGGLEDTAQSNSVTNETGFANLTTFTAAGASSTGEPRTFVLTEAYNTTVGSIDILANVTLNTDTGVLENSTTIEYPDVSFSYTYLNNSAEQQAARDAQTDTTRAIPLTGILFIIVAISAIIAILFFSFSGRRSS